MQRNLEKLWYGQHTLRWVLWPFSYGYQLLVSLRRVYLKRFKQQRFSVPIIVVGNLTLGGVGKTPLVIALASALKEKGLQVGIVSRGYRATIKDFPYEVKPTDKASLVGDEPLLLAKKTRCPVVIAPKRVDAVQYLIDHYQSQVIISDDGLQHYAMGRDLEIIVIDGIRGLGNGLCLPAGPLREPAWRLRSADFIIVNSSQSQGPYAHHMVLQPKKLINLVTGQSIIPQELTESIAAVAAIGHPERFYTTLTTMGITFNPYSFPDHHAFKATDLKFKEKNVIMTEKDAVKCEPFAVDSWYFLSVEAKLSDTFWSALWSHEQMKRLVST